MIHLLTTDTTVGASRRAILLPQLAAKKLPYQLHYGNALNGRAGRENEYEGWKSIITDNYDKDYIIIMEDDCTFRDNFFYTKLVGYINQCKDLGIVALLTGCSNSVGITATNIKGLTTIKSGTGTQLTVIFKAVYDWILEMPSNNHIDLALTSLSQIEGFKIGLTLPYFTGQLKTGESLISGFEIGEMFENEEQRLLNILNPPTV